MRILFSEILERGTPHSRNYLNYKGREYRQARIVWNVNNPDDTVGKGYLIHHIDGDPLNDSIENLQKCTFREHAEIHHKQGDWGKLGQKRDENTRQKMRDAWRERKARGYISNRETRFPVEKVNNLRKRGVKWSTIECLTGISITSMIHTLKVYADKGVIER